MSDKMDYKKEHKDLYQPKTVPVIVDVPKMKFIMVDGKGNPNDESGEYTKAIELLYGLSYTIKMSNKNGKAPSGFFEYVVPPLEGLWWTEIDRPFDTSQKDKLIWTAMIRQPEFVTEEVFEWAVDELKNRKPQIDASKARLEEFTEGLCVQMMHLGPFDREAVTVKAIDDFAAANGYVNAISEVLPDGTIRRHHEIYLNDPRKVAPEKMKTVIRHPIRK
ncbi:GyrI-like domain-containing protein [Parasporobacterium paucivorans]|nr:GyrI-like domain-containing protein [Parasporobacterium paucivorans]